MKTYTARKRKEAGKLSSHHSFSIHFDRLTKARKELADAKKEIKRLQKKVSSLSETIVWILNQ